MSDQHRPLATSDDSDWEALARFAAGESPQEEAEQVRAALDADPLRRAMLAALDDSFRVPLIAPLAAEEVEQALRSVRARRDDAVMASPRAPNVISLSMYRRRWQDARLRAAAAVLIVASAGLLWRTVAGPSTGAAVPAGGIAHFATAIGALDTLRLPDGSGVLLGPGSELTLSPEFASGTREVTLRGEARFDVVHSAAHPFVVRTAAASFRDVGTVFSVHSDAGDGARVVVSSGAVAVESTGSGSRDTLRAGDLAQVSTGGSVRVERAAASPVDNAWASGQLIFRDASVAQVTADLRRWYWVELVVDSALQGKTVTASFHRDPVKDVAAVVAALLGGRVQVRGDTLHITSSAGERQK